METEPYAQPRRRAFFWIVAAILLASGLLRLYRIDAPLVDCFWDKQVAVANRARYMAGPPFDPWHASFDFCITMDGRREPYTEEFPLYHALVAVGYRVFGEQDWFGRALSAVGSLVAILALIGLMRREYDDRFALLTGVVFAGCPMLVFYGRAVIPDVWMLACMLASAYFFRVALEVNIDRPRGTEEVVGKTSSILPDVLPTTSSVPLLASGVAGLLAVAFKYYGLMVLLPMAEMAWRLQGRRGLVRLCLPAVMMVVPLAAWMGFVFFQTANPSQGGKYFVFQQPAILLEPSYWARLADRFLWKSCGPVTAVLLVIGVVAVAARSVKGDSPIFVDHGFAAVPAKIGTVPKIKSGPIVAWTVMGLAFFFLLAPKSYGHEYYELMMLPAGAGWAALGLCCLFDRSAKCGVKGDSPIFAETKIGTVPGAKIGTVPQGKSSARARQMVIGGAFLCAAVVVHSPWISTGRFQQDIGFVMAAESVQKHCSPTGRVAVGPMTPQAVIHYAQREGWTWQEFPQDWRSLFARYRELGAECIVLYFDRKTPPAERDRYAPVLQALPILEYRSGPWGLGGTPCEYYILGFRGFARLKFAHRDRPD